MTATTKYNYIKVLGPLQLERITPINLERQSVRVCILMGPTGAGKSAFIESLAAHQGLKISGNSIDGVTQNVVCYKVINLQDSDYPVVLMDTPGLLDPQISERKIITMISNALNDLRDSTEMAIITLCYFHPIDVARVGGTKRTAVQYLKGFAQTFKASNVNVITTMWNNLWNPKLRQDGENRFRELSVEIFKGLASLNISLDKFMFTKESTLSILDASRHGWHHTRRKEKLNLPEYDNLMLNGLIARIQSVRLELDGLSCDDETVQAVRKAEDKAQRNLHRLYRELYEYDAEKYRLSFPDAPFHPTEDDIPDTTDISASISIIPSANHSIVSWCKNHLGKQTPAPLMPRVDGKRGAHAISGSLTPRSSLGDNVSGWWRKHSGPPSSFTIIPHEVEIVHPEFMYPMPATLEAFPQPVDRASKSQYPEIVVQTPLRPKVLPGTQALNASAAVEQSPSSSGITPKLQYLSIMGDISVEPVTTMKFPEDSKIYLLIGNSGAGMSAFVEALQGDSQNLAISSNKLQSCTQNIMGYHLVNVLNNGSPIYLVDVPALIGQTSGLSQMEVLKMVPNWLEQNSIYFFHQILYMHSIKDTRMTRFKRSHFPMIMTLLAATHDVDSLLVVTTQWDNIYDEPSQERANSNFARLRDEMLKDFIDKGAEITCYFNTKSSALWVLDRPLPKKRAFDTISFTAFTHLYVNLHKQIERVLGQLLIIEEELRLPKTLTNAELMSLEESNLIEYEVALKRLLEQFVEAGDPPRDLADKHLKICQEIISTRPTLLDSIPGLRELCLSSTNSQPDDEEASSDSSPE